MTYRVILSPQARSDLASITDERSKKAIGRRIDDLSTEPQKRGKPMQDELKGLYSARAAGQRYRVLYEVREHAGLVMVVVIGIRMEGSKRDVYQVAKRRLRKRER